MIGKMPDMWHIKTRQTRSQNPSWIMSNKTLQVLVSTT